jgi:hypothetical protein
MQETRICCGVGFRSAEMELQEATDGLMEFDEGLRQAFASVLGARCEENREESDLGHSHFTQKGWQSGRKGYAGLQGRKGNWLG